MQSVRVGISTQTPFLRFTAPAHATLVTTSGRQVQLLSELREGVDFQYTPGGVSRLVVPSVREWTRTGWLKEAHWFSLQPAGPRSLHHPELPLHFHHLSLAQEQLAAYGRTKEKLWADLHGKASPPFDAEDFRFYARYNWFTSDALLETVPNLDLAYVHDFQLLQVGAIVGLAAPTVLRWHVPLDPARIPRYTRQFVVKAMEAFDTVIVSTRRDLEGLLRVGFRGVARQLYPHIDRDDWPEPSAHQREQFDATCKLKPDDKVILVVARMDPMKRQDVAIRALARLRARHPSARLVLVGNGSFSGSTNGGLGLSKADQWVRELEALSQELRVADAVTFAHWLPDNLVEAAYERAHVVLLPSDIEGFGLTTLEAWRYGTPAIVSSGAGVSEVVQDGLNGWTFPPGDDQALAERLDWVLRHPRKTEAVEEAARNSIAAFDVRKLAPLESEVLQEAITRYREG